MSPYREALAWITQAPDTDSARGLAKLILSLSNTQCPFSLADCFGTISGPQIRLAMRVVSHYVERGEDDDSQDVATEVCRLYPRLVLLGQAMVEAARQLAKEWLYAALVDEVNRRKGQQPDDDA